MSNIVDEARHITSALRRVRNQLETNVSLVDDATQALGHDGELISETLDEHAYNLKGALHKTKNRLNAVKTVAYWEKLSVFGSLAFFTAVIIYIIAKRTRALLLLSLFISKLLNRNPDISAKIKTPEFMCRKYLDDVDQYNYCLQRYMTKKDYHQKKEL